jgi:hypothetical protein
LKAGASAAPSAEAPEMPARRITDPGRSASNLERKEGVSSSAEKSLASGRQATTDGSRRAELLETRAGIEEKEEDGNRSRRQRVATAARDVVDEKLSPRVEKLRHASNVMLEEAAYDPSLRFVLVAVIILILCLSLLLLNYLLG